MAILNQKDKNVKSNMLELVDYLYDIKNKNFINWSYLLRSKTELEYIISHTADSKTIETAKYCLSIINEEYDRRAAIEGAGKW